MTLAQRAVACKHWRWTPGMKDLDGYRMLRAVPNTEACWAAVHEDGLTVLYVYPKLPDLTDPATRGCLLALVREAHQCPEALVAALEAAP